MRSLRSRLFVLWLLSIAAALAVGVLLVGLYRQSSSAQLDRAQDEVAQACGRISDRFGYYATGWAGPAPSGDDRAFRTDLTAVVEVALAGRPGLAGGIWQQPGGVLAATADLTTDLRDSVAALAAARAAGEQTATTRIAEGPATILLDACPLRGPVAGLSAFAFARVEAPPGQNQLRLGLAVLLALVLGMTALLSALVGGFARRVAGIESALAGHVEGTLPRLSRTGEQELDRIVVALNTAGDRLEAAHRQSDALAGRVAQAERLVALGQVAAGVAHEIRNPIAAMRLKAENALFGDDTRRRAALDSILAQIDRLDRLLGELLTMTQRRDPAPVPTAFPDFLEAIAVDHRLPGVTLNAESPPFVAQVDPELLRRALDSLVQNAVRHTPRAGVVTLQAELSAGTLRLTVADTGPGVPEALRETLFEPFVTGSPSGTGLGLAIARELVQAHGGTLTLQESGIGAVFVIEIRCPSS